MFLFIVKKALSLFDVDRGAAFGGLFDLERNSIAFPKLAELNAFQAIGMEKQIVGAVAGDKTEVFVGQFFDGSLHTNVKIKLIRNTKM